MGTAVIWDLDGTLFDSYTVIVESIYQTFQESGIRLTREQIKDYAIRYSSSALFYEVADERGIAAETLFRRNREISRSKYEDIQPMDGAPETLASLQAQGVTNYVFTHRGKTTIPVLNHLKLTSYFRQILTSESGFPRKPDPEAILYLIREHGLDFSKTYYVGDRKLDMDCAKNAGIAGILLSRPGGIDVADGTETYVVSDLRQIVDIVIK